MKNLKALRQSKKLSQRTFAELMGFHTTTYQRWENGQATITINNAMIIAEFNNVSLDYLCGLIDEPKPLHE